MERTTTFAGAASDVLSYIIVLSCLITAFQDPQVGGEDYYLANQTNPFQNLAYSDIADPAQPAPNRTKPYYTKDDK